MLLTNAFLRKARRQHLSLTSQLWLFTYSLPIPQKREFARKYLFTYGEIPDEPYTAMKTATYDPCRTKNQPLDVVNRDGEPIHIPP